MFLQSSISPKPSQNPTSPLPLLFFFPTQLSKPLHFQNPNKPPHNHLLLLRAAAAAADTQTLPQSAIKRIADKLRSLGYVEDNNDEQQTQPQKNAGSSNSPGEIFVPLPNQLPKYRVGHTIDQSWSTPENPVPEPGSGSAITRYNELRREVWKEKRERARENPAPTLAELKLSEEELRRLRGVGIGLKTKLRVGKAGITEGIVNGIHERWRRTELVKIVCEDMCRLNMKRTHDLLERKTGGLVIWRSGSNIILYRGADYKYPYFIDGKVNVNGTSGSSEDSVKENYSSDVAVGNHTSNNTAQPTLIQGVGSPNRVRFQLPGEAQLAEEADVLLQGLGPRFSDWYGYDPVPVDADLLPAVVPGYRRPFRLIPYGVKPKLTNDEMTTLRRLGRPLPCHFALGRNRKLQGLAAAIVKLWEKCEIAKIAVKRGVQNTNSEMMTEELKHLTGGTVLSRDKEYIVLYRGKDFLPATVSSVIEERRNHGVHGLERKKISSSLDAQEKKNGSVASSSEADNSRCMSDQTLRIGSEERKLRTRELAIARTSAKLSLALEKKEKAEKLLLELDKEEMQKQLEIDKEGITEEERYMLRRVGLKMKPFLLLGRRGVFDGTVENMHLHWKYRELVKILSGEKNIDEVHAIAQTLEAESGGILVAVERVSKGYVIIMYRGKNYKRPASLRPHTLLNKREALKRSIEAQRRESLKLHVLKLNRNLDELKLKLAREKETTNMQRENDSQLHLDLNEGQSVEYNGFQTCKPSSASNEENVQGRDGHGGNAISFSSNDHKEVPKDSLVINWQHVSTMEYEGNEMVGSGNTERQNEVSMDSVKARQQNLLNVSFKLHAEKDGCKLDKPDSMALSELVKETPFDLETDGENGEAEHTSTSTFSDDSTLRVDPKSLSHIHNAEPRMSVTKNEVPLVDSILYRADGRKSDEIPFRAARLSNKERLLLRKQALKMKRRPVLAVGRSNIVTGVAKTIKTHFQKHPLAIVNIKGIAKGTSVEEVVSKLEEATGSVLVSREPSKVILYRGWGTNEEPGQAKGNISRVLQNSSNPRDSTSDKPMISPELISAIRLECGLQGDQEG